MLIWDLRTGVWLMPLHRMHITALEVTFSKTAEEVDALRQVLAPAIPTVAGYTHAHRARLVKPMVSHDLSAFAVSFLPASGEPPISPAPVPPDHAAAAAAALGGDRYTYHHLRRDLWDLARDAGVTVDSRYVVPSAHITLGRFLDHDDHTTPEQRRRWVETIDEINKWLEREIWGQPDGELVGEWIVGQEKGLDVRVGTLWYGGGRTVLLGEGF